jgi:hypothetical protein
VDSSDFQIFLDLEYPLDKELTSESNLWSEWRNLQSPSWPDNLLADDGHAYQCRTLSFTLLVDITEYALDGKVLLQMTSRPTFNC